MSAKPMPKGAIVIDDDIPHANGPDINQVPGRVKAKGAQIWVSEYVKRALTRAARKAGKTRKVCADEALIAYLRKQGWDIELQDRKDDNDQE